MITLAITGFCITILGWLFRVSLERTDVRPMLSEENYEELVDLFDRMMGVGIGLAILGMIL